MAQIKNKLNLCFIFSIIVLVCNIIMAVVDYKSDVSNLWIILDIIYVLCSIVSVVAFAIFRFKPVEYCLKNKNKFVVIGCVSCICSLLLGFVAMLTIFNINAVEINNKIFNTNKEVETEGKVIPTAEEIKKKLDGLDELRKNSNLTDEEYNKLRQEILQEIVNGKSN